MAGVEVNSCDTISSVDGGSGDGNSASSNRVSVIRLILHERCGLSQCYPVFAACQKIIVFISSPLALL